MKILGTFHDNGKKKTQEIDYSGTLDEAKKELLYVEFEGKCYEWFMIIDGFADYDHQAEYTALDKKPPANYKVYQLVSQQSLWDALKCECGADAVSHPGHSFWCPKWVGYK